MSYRESRARAPVGPLLAGGKLTRGAGGPEVDGTIRQGRDGRRGRTRILGLTRTDGVGYLLLLPMLIALCAFTLYPLVDTVWLGFTNSNGVFGSFIGLRNYIYVLTDSVFWDAAYNTIYMGGLTIILGVPISLVIATLINAMPAARSVFKAVYFAPNVTSAIASSIAFMYVFYPTGDGWMNVALGWFGIEPLGWFSDPRTARFGVVIMSVWHGLGYLSLIWLAGLQTVPKELYESAAVDGAGALRRWWHVTVPGLRPITFFIIVVEMINSFKRFADVYQIGGADGAPGGVLTTLMIYVYRNGFNTFEFGRASAATCIIFVFIIVATVITFQLFSRRDD